MSREIDNTDDIIDSRDVINRIEELEEQTAECADCDGFGEISGETCETCEGAKELPALDDDERAELASLKALASEAEGYAADWKHGETLIRDSHFQSYAQELAEEIGAIDDNAKWPMTCIDWDQAARELQHDYTSVDFDGVTYWVR